MHLITDEKDLKRQFFREKLLERVVRFDAQISPGTVLKRIMKRVEPSNARKILCSANNGAKSWAL